MAATITIYGKGGSSHEVVPEASSVRKMELMKEDYIRLVFTTKYKININLGDYITHETWGTFYITKPQKGVYNKSTGGYDYDLQFDAAYYKWNNKLYKFEPGTKRNEASWSLTDKLENHMAVFLRNLTHHGWNYTVDPLSYQVDGVDKAVFIQFDNKYMLDALTQIAEAFNVEWWITDTVIHFGKAEHGTAVQFEVGVNVEEMSAEKSSGDYISRLYAFGAARNLPPDYRKNDEQVLLNGVVQKRVMMPELTPYVDIENGLTDDEIVEGIVLFDDVYPRTESAITQVMEIVKPIETNDSTTEATTDKVDENDEEQETATFYRFKKNDFLFSKDYILAGQTLQIQFTSGLLNGMTFDLAFNPDGLPEKTYTHGDQDERVEIDNPDAQVFEIVRNETYGLFLPNETLKPQVNDTLVLLGWDITKVEDGLSLVTAAENELYQRAQDYAARLKKDPLTYPCTMMADYMYGLTQGGQQDPNYSKVGTFELGQRIQLVSDALFDGGVRVSRVVGFEYKLDKPYDGAVIYVGESATYSGKKDSQAKLNEAVNSINYRNSEYGSTGAGGSFYVIGTNDTTTPGDSNVYSALRSDRQYARKNKNDVISSLWTFKHGNGLRRGLQTQEYNGVGSNEDNLFGKGFELISKTNAQGDVRTRLEVDELFVRIKAFFAKLEIREISYVGGNYCFSAAGSRIYYVDWIDASGNVIDKTIGSIADVYKFRCYLYSDDGTTATINKWAVDDQVMCRTFNIDSGVHQNVSNKYYWRRVTGIGRGVIPSQVVTPEYSDDEVPTPTEYQYVDISMADCAMGSDYPEAEDAIVQFGNWSNSARQGVIYLMVEGESAPAIMEYSGVGANGQHFVLPDPTLLLSPTKNVIYGEFHSVVDSGGSTGGGDTIDDQIQALIDALNDIKNQADKKMEMWFGAYVPLPNSDNPNATANYPASEWITDELKALHAQDLFYDTFKAPATQRGRAYRWIAAEGENDTIIYYWEEVTDQDTIDALEKIADVASDGLLTGGAEKVRVFLDWQKAAEEYLKYTEQAHDYGITTQLTEYRTAFKALAKMLNDDVELVTSDTMTSIPTPAWLQNLQTETAIPSPTTYRTRWTDYYTTLAALLKEIQRIAKALADAAQTDATSALNKIDDMADDDVLTEFEKLICLREWETAKAEKTSLVAQFANDPNASTTTLVNNFNLLSHYLDDKSTTDYSDFTGTAPALLVTSGNTAIDGDVFKLLWKNYYDARSSLLASVSSSKVSTFVQSTRPNPPYKVGDLWIQTDNDDNIMVCVMSKTASQTGADSDWAGLSDITENRDPRILITAMVSMYYSYYGGYVKELTTSQYINVHLGTRPSTGSRGGEIAYYSSLLYQWDADDGYWTQISNESLNTTLARLHEVIGNYTLRVFRSTPNITPQIYDIICFPLTFTDSNLPSSSPYKTVEAGIQIRMYNGSQWEILQEVTKSLIENLPGYVRALAMKSAEDYSTTAGFITAGDWATLFAQATDADGNLIAQAHMSAFVTKDSNGVIQSGVSIGADQIVFTGKQFSIDADHINLTGTDNISLLVGGVRSDLAYTGINIEEGKITLNSENTVFNGNIRLTNPNEGIIIYDSYKNEKISVINKTLGSFGNFDFGSEKSYSSIKLTSRSSSGASLTVAHDSMSIGTFAAGQKLELHEISVDGNFNTNPFDTEATLNYTYVIQCELSEQVTLTSGVYLADGTYKASGSVLSAGTLIRIDTISENYISRGTNVSKPLSFALSGYINNSLGYSGEYYIVITNTFNFIGSSQLLTGAFVSRMFLYCQRVNTGINRIGTDGAVFASSGTKFNWFGSDFTIFRGENNALKIDATGLLRAPYSVSSPSSQYINIGTWGDISSTMPYAFINDQSYTASLKDAVIIFSNVFGVSNPSYNLYLPEPSTCPGKVYYVKNIADNASSTNIQVSGNEAYMMNPGDTGRVQSYDIGKKSAIIVSVLWSWAIFYCG